MSIKKMYLKRCVQPGAKGLAARQQMKNARNWLGWIPIFGWILIPMMVPTEKEIEEALEKQRRGIKL